MTWPVEQYWEQILNHLQQVKSTVFDFLAFEPMGHIFYYMLEEIDFLTIRTHFFVLSIWGIASGSLFSLCRVGNFDSTCKQL